MKQILLFFTFLMVVFQAKSQYYSFNQTIRTCATDATQNISQYQNWDIYKTVNDLWDGTKDSSFCGVVNASNEILLNQFNAGETFFIRYQFDNTNKELLIPNALYGANLYGNLNGTDLNLNNDCNETFCTGIYVAVEIPDYAGTGTDLRWYESPFHGWGNWLETSFCVPTEYFSANYLREIIIKITVQNPIGSINFYDFFMEENWFSQTIQNSLDVYYDPFEDSYQWYIYDHVLVLKADTTLYPNLSGIEYFDLLPVPNVDTAVTMDILIESYSSLIFQPFVQLRGGYLLNDSTQRHNYNVINNGGNLCFPSIIERVFQGGDNYIHRSGTIDFAGKMACMEFGNKSKFILGDSAVLHYGYNGMGNLALRPGGTIEIGKNAELILNNNLVLYEFPYNTKAQQIYMTLNEGSKLTFGKGAKIRNDMSIDGTMKLNIYMKGGTVDLSGLDADSRQLVNLIYDEAEPNFSDNIQLLGNPVSNNLRFSMTSDYVSDVTITLFTIDGKRVLSDFQFINRGINYIETDISNLPNGLYFLHLQSENETVEEKVLIMR